MNRFDMLRELLVQMEAQKAGVSQDGTGFVYSEDTDEESNDSTEDDEIMSGDDEEDDEDEADDNMDVDDETDQSYRLVIYTRDDDPYKTIETDSPTVFQVLGNEVITMTRGEGMCCLCRMEKRILYVDNSFGANIPAQLCIECIGKILDSETH